MADLSRDPIHNVYDQIKGGIRVTLANEYYASAVILIFSGIDTMAYVNMPQEQQEVRRDDFVQWAERYIRFPCKEQVSGLELYGARCGMLHTHSIASGLSRKGEIREVGYVDKNVPEVSYNPSVLQNLVIVSIEALADAFFSGIDKFLVESFADRDKAPLVEGRLRTLVHRLSFEKGRGQ